MPNIISVVHIAPEDSFARVQSRLLDITDDAPENLLFATVSEKLCCGLEIQIERFLAEHIDTALIIIDTLQRIRNTGGDANAYANDYHDIEILKALADKHRVAILLIHHLRKQFDEDPMNMISGTTGISGAADSSFVLRKIKRGSNAATLYCTGRDIAYRELSLEFDADAHVWSLLSDSVSAEPEPHDSIVSTLVSWMRTQGDFCGTATTLSEALEAHTGERYAPAALVKRLVRCRDELTACGIEFSSSRTREHRELRLTYLGDGSDGSDGKNATASVPNLPSQPSQPSRVTASHGEEADEAGEAILSPW